MASKIPQSLEMLQRLNRRIIKLTKKEQVLLEEIAGMDDLHPQLEKNIGKVKQMCSGLKQHCDSMSYLLQVPPDPQFGFICPAKKPHVMAELTEALSAVMSEYPVAVMLFTIEDLDLGAGIVEGKLLTRSGEMQCLASIPPLIYNITLHSKRSSIKTMRGLRKSEVTTVVNPLNFFNQTIIFDILSSLSPAKDCLLPYTQYNVETLKEYLDCNDSVVLLPERGILNNRAIRIRKNLQAQESYAYVISFGEINYQCDERSVFRAVGNLVRNRKYLLVEDIDPVMLGDSPLEARVFVQKDNENKWQVTEKIAKSELLYPGRRSQHTATKLHTALIKRVPNNLSQILERLEHHSINNSAYLDYYLPDVGSLMFDYLIDAQGNPRLIYVGGWDCRDFLYTLQDQADWHKYLANCFHYLRYLKESKVF